MIEGKNLWDQSKSGELYEVKLEGMRSVDFYRDTPMNLYAALLETSDHNEHKTAIVDDSGNKYTYQDLLEHVEELAAYLKYQKGINNGAYVGLLLRNSYEFCISLFALNRINAVTVPLPTKFTESEVCNLIKNVDLDTIICESPYSEWIDDSVLKQSKIVVSNEMNEFGMKSIYKSWEKNERKNNLNDLHNLKNGQLEDKAILMFTSGTTSNSKGVIMKNYNVMHAVESYKRLLNLDKNDSTILATPIYHVTGVIAVLALFIRLGATLYLHKSFNAKRVIEECRVNKISFIHASPSVFNLLILEGEDTPEIPSLRKFACGSSNMPKEKLLRLNKWLPNSIFHTVYGLTETSSPATIFPHDAATSRYIGSSGWPIPGTIFKIIDDQGIALAKGKVGEIAVSGTVVTSEYYNYYDEKLADGWLFTGDMGYFNDDNYLFVVDRKKDMINRGGEKIWCFDLENEIISIRGIKDAAVVGVPHDVYGEVPVAAVVLEENEELVQEDIISNLMNRVAKYKLPEQIRVVDCIPLTPNGKINKRLLRDLFMEEK